MKKDLLYLLALTRVPGIGPVYAKRLLHHFGEAEAVFKASPDDLAAAPWLGPLKAKAILDFDRFSAAEKELAFLEKYAIRCLAFTDKDYPQRLLSSKDAPVILFYKGAADLNASRIIAVVGTRSPTEYGRSATEQFIKELADCGPLVVSGLAYGIDAVAHKAALKNSLPTVGVLGHGLDRIYPAQHTVLAREMVKQGGLLTGFMTGTKPDAHHFPTRNLIVAGMSDALVVAETDSRGGSMITVRDALDLKKTVYAFPGRLTDTKSSGCNRLIQKGEARLISDVSRLVEELKWAQPQTPPGSASTQTALFPLPAKEGTLSDDESLLFRLLKEREKTSVDELSARTGLNSSDLAMALLNLELEGLILSLPGKMYRLVV